MMMEGRDCLRDNRRCIDLGVGGVDMPSASGDSGTSVSACGECVRGNICVLSSVVILTNVPNALDRSFLGEVGDLVYCARSVIRVYYRAGYSPWRLDRRRCSEVWLLGGWPLGTSGT